MSDIHTRKSDHIRISLEDDTQFLTRTNGLERFSFKHCCLPELDLAEINLSTTFLGKELGAPILISSMTGGNEQAKLINQRLAEVAQKYQFAMGVGSQRVAIEDPNIANTFSVRAIAPDILLFANMGAIQLNNGYGYNDYLRAIDDLQADALILHLNPLQECVQSNGNTNFKGLLENIEKLCSKLPVPVVVKEVGNGISEKVATRLINAGVSAIDVAGAGGTSWAKVESARANTHLQQRLGETFSEWGIATADCIIDVRKSHPKIPLIASGGIRNGLEAAKAIALGADLVGLALPFLKVAAQSPELLDEFAQTLIAELKTAFFCTGNIDIDQLIKSNSLFEKVS